MASFAELAKVKTEDLPEVKLIPMGSFIWSVDRVPEMKPSKSGKGTTVSCRLKLVSPIENFEDPAALADFGNPAGIVRTLYFYVPDHANEDEDPNSFERRQAGAVQRLNRFLAADLQVEGDTLEERLSNSINHQCIGTIQHTPDDRNPQVLRDEIIATAPIV
ncbi:MAG TPA: hypothetical protein VLA89_19220 [Gemmatimonadales bacterium]|nr:hypothetical protein [Gemmatimonadales bacterium]